MSAATATPFRHRTDVSTGTSLARVVASEWTRLWTVRSTWWALAGAAAMMLLLGFAFGQDAPPDPGLPGGPAWTIPVWVPGEIAIAIGQFALYVLVMLAVTAEYATGAIRSSLQAVPRRGLLLLARTVVVVVVATVAAVALAASAGGMASIGLGDAAEVVPGDIAHSLTMIAVVVACGSLITVGLGAFLRSSAGTLTSIFLLMLVLPQLLPVFGIDWLTSVGEHLPGYASMSLLEAFGIEQSVTRASMVLAAWVAASLVVGTWSLLRRDAA